MLHNQFQFLSLQSYSPSPPYGSSYRSSPCLPSLSNPSSTSRLLCSQEELILCGPKPISQTRSHPPLQLNTQQASHLTKRGRREYVYLINIPCPGEGTIIILVFKLFLKSIQPKCSQVPGAIKRGNYLFFFFFFRLCCSSYVMNVSPHNIVCVVDLAYFPIHPPAQHFCYVGGGWRNRSSSTEGYCHENLLKRFDPQPCSLSLSSSICMQCV